MTGPDEPSRPDRRFWRKAPTANVADEVAFHLQSAIDEGLAAGLSSDDAHAAARQRFGDVERVSAELRHLAVQGEQTLHRREWLESVAQDARHGLRQLRASPGFTLIALLTLGLGIGANTAIFSLVDSVMLRPLGFADPSRLYDLRPLSPEGDAHYNVAFPNYLAWSTGTRLFAAIGGTTNQSFTLTGVGAPQRLTGLRASATYWQALESPPVAGRYFTQAEDRVGGPRVVVISHALFVNAFGSDPGVVGRAILLDGLPFTVIGIAPDTYAPIANGAALWVPLAITTRESQMYGDHEMVVTGRLRPGVSLDAGLAELRGFERDIQHTHPDDGFTGKVVGRPAVEALVGNTAERQFLVLLGAVGLVLLIACGNVANLLLARAVSRRGEIAVRSALGANRRRIVAQMLVESGVLTMGGALLGVAAGAIILRVLVASAPAGIPRLADATINGRVLLFTMVVAIVAGLLFGVVPAWRASQTDLQATLRASGRDGRTGSDPLRGALVIAEIAVALVLLTAAGLLIRSSMAMQREATGFDASSLLTTRVALPIAQYGDLSVGGTYARILDGVRAIPGVTSAAMISRMPIGAGGADCMVTAPGITPAGDDGRDAQFRSVSPDYFHTIGTPILRGRAIDATDMTGGPLVAVINARLAHSLFGDRDPIGRQILHCIGINDGYQHTAARTVVGVAADVRANGLDNDFVDQVYYPYTQFFERTAALLVRTSGDPVALMPAVRRAVAAVDPSLPLFRTATMEAIVHDSTASPRFTMLLLILLGGTGLLLAAIGIYGVIAYQVGQRTREIGVRLALGATPGSVWSLVVRQAMTVALAGVLAGELLALLAARALSGLIYGVAPSDPLTFTSMGVILTGTALVAALVPAVRATRIDPIRALRS